MHRENNLEVAPGLKIQSHILMAVNGRNTGNIAQLVLLSLFKIMQNDPCRYPGRMGMFDAESFE